MGVEPTYPVWKTGVLADVLIPHKLISLSTLYKYYTTIFKKNQIFYSQLFGKIVFISERGRKTLQKNVTAPLINFNTVCNQYWVFRFTRPLGIYHSLPQLQETFPLPPVTPRSVSLIHEHWGCLRPGIRQRGHGLDKTSICKHWCLEQDSNLRQVGYEPTPLPTEVSRHSISFRVRVKTLSALVAVPLSTQAGHCTTYAGINTSKQVLRRRNTLKG